MLDEDRPKQYINAYVLNRMCSASSKDLFSHGMFILVPVPVLPILTSFTKETK